MIGWLLLHRQQLVCFGAANPDKKNTPDWSTKLRLLMPLVATVRDPYVGMDMPAMISRNPYNP